MDKCCGMIRVGKVIPIVVYSLSFVQGVGHGIQLGFPFPTLIMHIPHYSLIKILNSFNLVTILIQYVILNTFLLYHTSPVTNPLCNMHPVLNTSPLMIVVLQLPKHLVIIPQLASEFHQI